MCEVIVCKVSYVKFLCVKLLYVKLLYVKFCMVSVREAAGGGGTRDTESKTRTPHKDVGKKL